MRATLLTDRRRLTGALGLGIVVVGLALGDRIDQRAWLAMLAAAWLLGLVAIWPGLPPEIGGDARRAVQTTIVVGSAFVLIAVQLLRTQVVLGVGIAHRAAIDPTTGAVVSNPRLAADLGSGRGRIVDRNGTVLAETVDDGDFPRRVAPDPAAAPVVGYFSPRLYGASGLEAAYDDALAGRASGNALQQEIDRLLGTTRPGLDLHLTLDDNLQDLADRELAGRRGAAVLLDARSGAVLALASSPHIDPSRLGGTDVAGTTEAQAYWATIADDPAAPLLPRATQGLLTPGSVFKVVTAAAALDSGAATPDSVYQDDGQFTVQGHTIADPNRPDASQTTWTLTQALGWSLNAVFAQVGLQLGPDLLGDMAARFGFGGAIPFDLPTAPSQLASHPGDLANPATLADTAFGQGELEATPLQMALVAACVANDGRIMRPYLVDRATTPSGVVAWQTQPTVWRRPMGDAAASQLAQMMVWGTTEGGYRAAAIPGYTVGGKTGTAETGHGTTHAWFIGWASDGARAYAVAVVVEEGGSGGGVALPIGRDLLAAALG
ncbi:MAG TPA: penicillin-binding transpeptidase domain-containing protein [Thermomicrobiales bacterium]|nr:penicillin-binding transpeptidase domain-containing protein [Thermomicrobiales bacterium]